MRKQPVSIRSLRTSASLSDNEAHIRIWRVLVNIPFFALKYMQVYGVGVSTNDRAAITRPTHGLQIKVQGRKENDFWYIKVLIEGRSEREIYMQISKSYKSNGAALFLFVISQKRSRPNY
jgi:hypothetical protein